MKYTVKRYYKSDSMKGSIIAHQCDSYDEARLKTVHIDYDDLPNGFKEESHKVMSIARTEQGVVYMCLDGRQDNNKRNS